MKFLTKTYRSGRKVWNLGISLGDILGYPPILAGDIRSRDGFRPTARERKDLMDYKYAYKNLRRDKGFWTVK